MNTKIKRDYSIDLIKLIAIIGVVIIHSCTFNDEVSSFPWLSSLFWRSISGASVPLFLMTSGALMLEGTKKLSLKKLYFKNILRIVTAMLFWGMVYKLYHLYMGNGIDMDSIKAAVYELLFFNHEFHFYYMHMILIVYAFLPIVRHMIGNMDKRALQYALLLFFIFAIAYPTLRQYTPFNRFEGMTTMWGINLTYASIGYGVLGYYLKKYPIKRAYACLLAIAGFAMTFGLTYLKSLEVGTLYEHFLAGNGIPVFVLGVGIYSLIINIDTKSTFICNASTLVSKASFFIYLVHMLVMYILKDLGFNTSFASYIWSIPVWAIANILICIVIYVPLSKIPLINKHLM